MQSGTGKVIVNSGNTGNDAIDINASAGGIDVDAASSKEVNISGGQVVLVSKDDAASAISLTTNQGTSETIVITNTQGTNDGAISLVSSAGGLTFTTPKDFVLTSQNLISSSNQVDINVDTNIHNNLNVFGNLEVTSQTVDIDTATFSLDASGTLGITSANTALTVASGTGALNISNDAANTTVNVGTGGGVKTCTFGSTNSTSATTIQSGTGKVIVNSANTGNDAIDINATAGGIDVDADGVLALDGGSGINIGVASDVAVDIDAAAFTLDASGTLGITSANTALTVISGTGALNISNDAANTTVNVGTGGGVKTCTFGSTNSSKCYYNAIWNW